MTTLLNDKRALERAIGCPVEFVRTPLYSHALAVHAVKPQYWESTWQEHSDTWLGSGDTHVDTIADCWETLRKRAQLQRRAGEADAFRESQC